MLRGVADTNVLVSALVAPRGVCGQLWEAAGARLWKPVVSDHLMDEVEGVLGREKFRRWTSLGEVARFVTDVWETAEAVVDAPQPWPPVTRDPKDDYLVALARSASVDALVSGDVHLTELVGLVAVSPADFLAMIREER